MLKYYNILENNYFKIIEQKNSIVYLIKKYKKNNNQFNEISSQLYLIAQKQVFERLKRLSLQRRQIYPNWT